MLPILIAGGTLAMRADGAPVRWESTIRSYYADLPRRVERGDASFLRAVEPRFIYIDPLGTKMTAATWSSKWRRACRFNRDVRVQFQLTELRSRGDFVVVSYFWSYRYRKGAGSVVPPRLAQSISTDTWRVVGKEPKLWESKDYPVWVQP